MGRRLKAARRLAIANLKSKIGLGFLLGVEKALVELHAKGQAESLELLLDLVEGLFAEVAVFEHLLLGLHRQLADGGDVGVVQAVRRADGELDLVDRHVEELAELVLLLGVLGGLALELVRLLRDAVEHVEVVLEDGGGLLESVVRRDAAVGPDLEDELVVIGDLADAGVLDRIADEADRGEERVDRDDADGLVFLLVVLAGAVAAAGLDLDLGLEGALVVEGADDLVRVDDLDVGVGLDVPGGDGALAVDLEVQLHRLALFRDNEDLFQIEDDVGHILDDAVDRLELVVHALDLDRADGAALDGAEEHAAEGVADGVAIAGLEGLGDELGVGGRGALLDLGELGGDFEFSETFGHGRSEFKWKGWTEAKGSEARVIFDDELLVDRGLHLVAGGQAGDGALEGLVVAREPAGDDAGAVFLDGAGGELAGGVDGLHLDLVALDHGVAGDVDLVTVDADVAVVDELAGRRAALGETEEVDDAVEAGLEELEEALAGDAALLLRDGEGAAELALEQAVDEAELLLLGEADGILGELAARLRAVLAGREIAALKHLGGANDILAETAADAGGWSCVASHGRMLDLRLEI